MQVGQTCACLPNELRFVNLVSCCPSGCIGSSPFDRCHDFVGRRPSAESLKLDFLLLQSMQLGHTCACLPNYLRFVNLLYCCSFACRGSSPLHRCHVFVARRPSAESLKLDFLLLQSMQVGQTCACLPNELRFVNLV